MPLSTVKQSGGLTALYPNEDVKMFDGTETPSAGIFSQIFTPAPGPGQIPSPILFVVFFAGGTPNATVLILGSNDGTNFATLNTFTNPSGGLDFYADGGGFKYYQAELSAYVSGGMPTVIAKR